MSRTAWKCCSWMLLIPWRLHHGSFFVVVQCVYSSFPPLRRRIIHLPLPCNNWIKYSFNSSNNLTLFGQPIVSDRLARTYRSNRCKKYIKSPSIVWIAATAVISLSYVLSLSFNYVSESMKCGAVLWQRQLNYIPLWRVLPLMRVILIIL